MNADVESQPGSDLLLKSQNGLPELTLPRLFEVEVQSYRRELEARADGVLVSTEAKADTAALGLEMPLDTDGSLVDIVRVSVIEPEPTTAMDPLWSLDVALPVFVQVLRVPVHLLLLRIQVALDNHGDSFPLRLQLHELTNSPTDLE